MTVSLIDKRRPRDRVPGVGLPNATWWAVLDIPGMDKFVDTRHFCDSATATPAKARRMADLIESWTPLDGWVSGDDRECHAQMKGYIIDFLRTCNGFRSQ
ncbi:TPA: hypothetical protein ACXPD2_000163 [Klebsiella pneumoniae]|uniref:DUF7739 domain-containing protein n=1 Tax=Klebsiella pneumoniae TaxID=573 RepID=UPI0016481C4B|nr:hypothetical protein [Klebsiella pneumoniae]EKW2891623.1 hypothetical protein [Klebsiella pneumoniae]ELA0627882.1 hypothetical protein [Klebsiella pneumoniae]MBC4125412.1 hypothetical protein [Klebsiella pneumoniae]MBX4703653.1 hypothetical protein [Klebsiella pneumoniae]MCD9656172.1 hypothetical protein [Klebsiella pneumoniae]